MRQLFARDNKEFLTNYIDTYGSVSKLHGFFGVSHQICIRCTPHIPKLTTFLTPG